MASPPSSAADSGPAPGSKRKGSSTPPPDGESKARKVQDNRAIFITNLPKDTYESEIAEVFGKYGIIDVGVSGDKRIKMYYDDAGKFNGEALVVYFKKESVRLAIQMMDDYQFRLGDKKNDNIKVREADMTYKRVKDSEGVSKTFVRKDRKAAERTKAELQQRLAAWDSDEEEQLAERYAPKPNKYAKCVIIKKAFTVEELETDLKAYAEIKEDMEVAAKKFGDITNVTLWDQEPNGIITIKFREIDEAKAFSEKTHGRGYSGRKLECSIAEERPRFRKSSRSEAEDLRNLDALFSDEETKE